MENKFKQSMFIEQIMVIGENEKHPAAFIVPDFEILKNGAKIIIFHLMTMKTLFPNK